MPDVTAALATPGASGWQINPAWTSVPPTWVAVPATAASAGVRGQMAIDASFLYACIAPNTWVRVGVSTW